MRSQFLTLLCVLTFLSCAWGISDAVVSLTQTDAVAETQHIERGATSEQQQAAPKQYYEDRSSGNQPVSDDPTLVRQLAVAQLAYSLLTLTGAIFMFRLRRVGFWIYIAGVITGLVLPIVLAGFGALNLSYGVFFSVLFAGLYWVKLNEMR